jgi:hypothetical protein
MENQYRLKIEVHGNSFEAEGDRETVNEQFRAFREMVSRGPAPPIPTSQAPADKAKSPSDTSAPNNSMPFNEEALNKIMQVQGRVVSLTVHPTNVEDALLLLVYGQKVLRQNELCTGGELFSGLISTGGYPVTRIDRLLHNMGLTGDLIVTGEHRAKKYRLANNGLTKVRQIAKDLLAKVP